MAKRKNYSDTTKLAILCTQSANDKLSENAIILDLQHIDIASCSYFVICDCNSTVQVRSIADNIIKNVTEHNQRKPRIEGLETSEWVILDFFDVVVHIFIKELRDYYKLEKLWADAKFFTVNDDAIMEETNYSDFKLEIENQKSENE